MKKFFGFAIILILLAVGYVVLSQDEPKRGGKYREEAEQQSVTMQVTSNGGTAKIRYSTQQDDAREGFVETPWSKTVLTETARISAEPGAKGTRVTCKIIDASSGKVLDSKAGKTVTCYYTTF